MKVFRLFLAGLLSVLWLPRGMAADAPATPGPVAVFVKATLKPEFRDRYLAAMRENVAKTRAETSKPTFDFFQDATGGNTFYQFEVWKDEKEHASHLEAAHARAAAEVRKQAVTEPPEVLRLTPFYTAAETTHEPPAEPRKTENLVVVFETDPQLRQEFLSTFDKLAADARKAPGNLVFDLYRVTDRPDTFVLFERWKDAESYGRHMGRDYVREFHSHLNTVVAQRLRHPMKDVSGE